MAGCKICLKTGIIICRLELVYRWIWRLCPCKHVHDCWVTSLPWAVPSHWEDFTIWNHYLPLKSLFAKKCHASVNQLHCPNSDFPPYHLIIHRQYISTELLLWLAVLTGLKTVQASRVWNYIWRGSEPTGWYCNIMIVISTNIASCFMYSDFYLTVRVAFWTVLKWWMLW